MTKIKSDLLLKIESLEAKNQDLQSRLEGAEEALRAISSGEVDALVVYGDGEERIYTLQGADYAYRVMVESIHEGAANIKADGTILYCNKRLAEMLEKPLETVLGSSFYDYLSLGQQAGFTTLIHKGLEDFGRAEFSLASRQEPGTSVLVTASAAVVDGVRGICLVVTDLTEQNQARAREIMLQDSLTKQREEERVRIARNLHDGPLQDLIVLSFMIHEKISTAQAQPMIDDLQMIRQTILKLISDLRNVCNDLRPPKRIHYGLAKAIQFHSEEIQTKYPDLTIDLELFEDGQSIPESTSTALFRIYQECMNNIVRHANATEANVKLLRNQNAILMEVQDNGKGFQPPEEWSVLSEHGHLGIVGMRERAEALGGKIYVSSNNNKGTTISVEVPYGASND